MSKLENKIYLSDGVFAFFDGWQVWLSLDEQDPNIRIALDARAMEKLKEFWHEWAAVGYGVTIELQCKARG